MQRFNKTNTMQPQHRTLARSGTRIRSHQVVQRFNKTNALHLQQSVSAPDRQTSVESVVVAMNSKASASSLVVWKAWPVARGPWLRPMAYCLWLLAHRPQPMTHSLQPTAQGYGQKPIRPFAHSPIRPLTIRPLSITHRPLPVTYCLLPMAHLPTRPFTHLPIYPLSMASGP